MQKFTPKQVKEYYNEMTPSYMEIYGDVIQAFRPNNTEKLLDYIGRSAGINWNMNVLDLGCGIAGPAIHFAKRWNANIDGVTISELQFAEAEKKILDNNFTKKVAVFLGDYHHLDGIRINDNHYDVVLFLESLGHSNNVALAIENAYKKMKSGGVLYIKDFYKRIVEDEIEQFKINKVIDAIDQYYAYNTLNLENVKNAIQQTGFKIEFIKPFDFLDDISVRFEFEKQNKIDIFKDVPEFYPADWFEIKCVK